MNDADMSGFLGHIAKKTPFYVPNAKVLTGISQDEPKGDCFMRSFMQCKYPYLGYL